MINNIPETQTETYIILLQNYKIIIENFEYNEDLMKDFWQVITKLSIKCEANTEMLMFILDIVKKITCKLLFENFYFTNKFHN